MIQANKVRIYKGLLHLLMRIELAKFILILQEYHSYRDHVGLLRTKLTLLVPLQKVSAPQDHHL